METIKICKSYPTNQAAIDAFLRWQTVPDEYKPTGITQVGRIITYDYVAGRHAKSYSEFEHAVYSAFWDCEKHKAITITSLEVNRYLEYVSNKLNILGLPDRVFYMEQIRSCVTVNTLTPVNNVHGDLTFENVIINPDTKQVTFIDLGVVRGCLYAKEIDEAKVLQSVLGWKNTGVFRPDRYFRRVHFALCLSHMARLLANASKHHVCDLDKAFKILHFCSTALRD